MKTINLRCDNFDHECSSELLSRDSWEQTLAFARSHGWHIFDGTTMGGQHWSSALCPACVGTRARLDPAPKVLEGQPELDL